MCVRLSRRGRRRLGWCRESSFRVAGGTAGRDVAVDRVVRQSGSTVGDGSSQPLDPPSAFGLGGPVSPSTVFALALQVQASDGVSQLRLFLVEVDDRVAYRLDDVALDLRVGRSQLYRAVSACFKGASKGMPVVRCKCERQSDLRGWADSCR